MGTDDVRGDKCSRCSGTLLLLGAGRQALDEESADLGLVVTVCLADQRGSQSCVLRAVLEGAV